MPCFLRLGGRDLPVAGERFVIGRSDDCDLCIEDPLASRHHAVIVSCGAVRTLQDMGSRNGVYVNSARIGGDVVLNDGDVIRIGDVKLTLVERRSSGAQTLAQHTTPEETDTFALLSGLAEKALTLGQGREAERIMGRHLEGLLEHSGGGLDRARLGRATTFALRIASLTKQARWVDYVFQLHANQGRLMDAEVVNELYAVCAKIKGASHDAYQGYLDSLADQRANYTPTERFVVGRIDGLKKQL